VDEAEDFELVKRVYEHFGHSDFSIGELFEYLEENPQILKVNSHIKRNEGYIKSLNEEMK
jgi:spore coat polysaccharide biosynthesis protein SpsF (cytidylyltransferase family)